MPCLPQRSAEEIARLCTENLGIVWDVAISYQRYRHVHRFTTEDLVDMGRPGLFYAARTLQALGGELGVTRERVHQIERRGLAKLRKAMAG